MVAFAILGYRGLRTSTSQLSPTISDWWDEIIQGKVKKEQQRISGGLLYAIWNAWKERNRRIFTAKRLTYVEVTLIAREDILQRERAFTPYVSAIPAEPD
jgi:hypothetical protein